MSFIPDPQYFLIWIFMPFLPSFLVPLLREGPRTSWLFYILERYPVPLFQMLLVPLYSVMLMPDLRRFRPYRPVPALLPIENVSIFDVAVLSGCITYILGLRRMRPSPNSCSIASSPAAFSPPGKAGRRSFLLTG
jgi:hypothetical protein